jgi:hypothetical protein
MSHIGPVGSAHGGAGTTFGGSWPFAIPQDKATSTAHDSPIIARHGRMDTPPKKRRFMVEPSQLVMISNHSGPLSRTAGPANDDPNFDPPAVPDASVGRSLRTIIRDFSADWFAKLTGWIGASRSGMLAPNRNRAV